LTTVAYPSGVGGGGNGTTGTFTYDPDSGLPGTIAWTGPAGATITSDAVTRTKGGRIVGQVVDGVDHHAGDDYVYDTAGRLTDAWVPGRQLTYRFDPTGGCGAAMGAGKNTNRTRSSVDGGPDDSYCYDHADRLTATTVAGVGAIGYDHHGNTTQIFGETHRYDPADRHLETTTDATTVTYVRDASDRIVERKLNGTTVARYGHTAAGDVSALTLDTTGAVLDAVIALPGGALRTVNAAGTKWSYPNIHGDITATADITGAKQGPTVVYDPYGNLVAGTTPDNATGSFDHGWLGKHQRPTEHETGLQLSIEMGARRYSPLLGRFLEVDPVDGGSCNDYDYVCGDAINAFDLDGNICLGRVCIRRPKCAFGKNRNGSCRGSRYVPGTKHARKGNAFCYSGKRKTGGCRGGSAARYIGRKAQGCVTGAWKGSGVYFGARSSAVVRYGYPAMRRVSGARGTAVFMAGGCGYGAVRNWKWSGL
jgi:RHS repeat-associated protein